MRLGVMRLGVMRLGVMRLGAPFGDSARGVKMRLTQIFVGLTLSLDRTPKLPHNGRLLS
jgi:hypothetical protein